MNREKMFQAMEKIDDCYIAESACYAHENTIHHSEKTLCIKQRHAVLPLVAALVLLCGVTVFAASRIFEYRSIKDNPKLQHQSEQGAADLQEFTFDGLTITPVEEALYINNDQGQSGVTDFYYTVDGTHAQIHISYYDTGEIETIDARELYPLDIEPYDCASDWFNAKYPDQEVYRERLIEVAPNVINTLHEEGWIRHSSEDIAKADILPIHVFSEPSAEIRVLMKDDCSYELWLEPDSFAIEGFMYWNEKDTQKIRNGFFPALKEDRLEEWWEELMANGVG